MPRMTRRISLGFYERVSFKSVIGSSCQVMSGTELLGCLSKDVIRVEGGSDTGFCRGTNSPGALCPVVF